MMSPLVRRALEIARSQVGVREVGGPNHGPQVEEYQKSVGAKPGDSWCAAFCYWAFREAAEQLNIINPCVRTAGALKADHMAQVGYHTDVPESGCLFFIDHGEGKGHVGFVDEVHDDGTLITCEGNTNGGGSRNGDGVYIRVRKRSEINAGYVDYSRALLPQATTENVA